MYNRNFTQDIKIRLDGRGLSSLFDRNYLAGTTRPELTMIYTYNYYLYSFKKEALQKNSELKRSK